MVQGLGVLEQRGLCFDLLLRPQHLKHVPVIARAFPRLRFVIDHIAKPLIKAQVMEPWKSDMAAAAACDNVYCKLSGMVTEANMSGWKAADLQPYIGHVVACFGWQRCLFGSDWPVCLLAASYSQASSRVRAIELLRTRQSFHCAFVWLAS